MEKRTLNFNNIVLGLLFVTTFLFPPIRLSGCPFALDLSLITIPLMLFAIIKNRWYKNDDTVYIILSFIIAGYIFFTIFINNQQSHLNNFFELYDVFYLFIVFIFLKHQYSSKIGDSILDIIFVILLIFNFLHFFNIFHFNQVVMPFYCGENNNQLLYFGYYSNGLPGPKRMIGTMMNPNHNAILFLFYLIRYIPHQNWRKREIIFFFFALIGLVLCQSRTGMIAFFFIIIINYLLVRIPWKKAIIQLAIIFAVFFFVLQFSSIIEQIGFHEIKSLEYGQTITDKQVFEGTSWKSRIDTWDEILNAAMEKPLFGYSPNKNYLYKNDIHIDSEYISMFYRYGFIGLVLYLLLFITPLLRSINLAINFKELTAIKMILAIVLFLLCAITNEPISNHNSSILYVIFLAIFYQYYEKYEKRLTTSL